MPASKATDKTADNRETNRTTDNKTTNRTADKGTTGEPKGNETADSKTNEAADSRNVKQTYKASIFEMIFREKPALLSLYNAVNGTDYQDPGLLTVNTLENAVYTNIHNDISFLADSGLNLYEHQSTDNPNMPLRFLKYVADLYSVLTKDANEYGTKLIPLPPPQFLVFYNGVKEAPEEWFLKLSAAFLVPEAEPSLELTVRVLNINAGHNGKLMAACKELGDYAEFVGRVRLYGKTLPVGDAVEKAVDECIREDILKEFLERSRAEVKKMSIYEYDAEKHIQMERKEAWEEGKEEGIKEGKEEGIKEGREEGKEEGIEIGVELIRRFTEAKRYKDLERIAVDVAYRQQVIAELGIS